MNGWQNTMSKWNLAASYCVTLAVRKHDTNMSFEYRDSRVVPLEYEAGGLPFRHWSREVCVHWSERASHPLTHSTGLLLVYLPVMKQHWGERWHHFLCHRIKTYISPQFLTRRSLGTVCTNSFLLQLPDCRFTVEDTFITRPRNLETNRESFVVNACFVPSFQAFALVFASLRSAY